MKRTTLLSLVAAILLVSASGCLKSRAQLRDDDDQRLRKGVPAKVEAVEPAGSYALDEIKNEITRLTGRIEDMERSNRGAGEEEGKRGERLAELEKKIQELEQTQVLILESLKKLEGKIPPPDREALYKQGRESQKAGAHEKAVELFTEYLKTSKPKMEESATFYRAESYYALKEYKKAIVDYSKFPEKFTKSKRMPEALYRIGLSFDALGMKNDAKAFFQEVAARFPKTAEAKQAKAKLAGGSSKKKSKKK